VTRAALAAGALALLATVGAATVARADDCLKPEGAFVVLNFVAHESDDARIVERVIEIDQSGWIVRRCDDQRLLDKIKRGDQEQLAQLLGRRIILAVAPEGTNVRHYVLPYVHGRVAAHHDIPAAPAVGMCHAGGFEDGCRMYRQQVHMLLVAAVGLYKASLLDCAGLDDAKRSFNEALAGEALSKVDDRGGDLAAFIAERSRELKSREAGACKPRDLNKRLIKDRCASSPADPRC
jgi:hypothetical protein